MRIFCIAKDTHIFPTKNNRVFVIFTFKIFNETLTNNVVNFEQLAPVSLIFTLYDRLVKHLLKEFEQIYQICIKEYHIMKS